MKIDCEGGEYDLLVSADPAALRRGGAWSWTTILCAARVLRTSKRPSLLALFAWSGRGIRWPASPVNRVDR